jgi:hypothetical protein
MKGDKSAKAVAMQARLQAVQTNDELQSLIFEALDALKAGELTASEAAAISRMANKRMRDEIGKVRAIAGLARAKGRV